MRIKKVTAKAAQAKRCSGRYFALGGSFFPERMAFKNQDAPLYVTLLRNNVELFIQCMVEDMEAAKEHKDQPEKSNAWTTS